MSDHDEAPSRRELAQELGLPYESHGGRGHGKRYGGLKVDEYGYDREGNYYPHLDGGGQE